MTVFRDLPIRRKLTVAVLGTTFVVLLAACAAFLAYERATFRRLMATNLHVLVDALAINSTAALTFADPDDAEETLHALRVKPSVEAACLYDAEGTVFATYARGQERQAVPPRPEADGTQFAPGHLAVVRPVMLDGQRLGTLYVRNDLSDLNAHLRAYAQISGLVLLGSLILASALSSALQRAITRPIFALTDTAKDITETRDYTVRATKISADEFGTLADGFNQMLAGIQERDTALQAANEALRAENAERKHAEEELRDREKLLRAVTDSSEDMIFIKDRDSRLLFMNPAGCRLIGRTPDQIMGHTDAELYLGAAQAAAFVEMDRRVLEAQRSMTFDEELITPAGERHILLTAKTPRLDDQGNVIGLIGISRDITERKRAEEEIRQLNASLEQRVRERTAQLETAVKELDAFSYSVSHDLRAPLRAVDGFSRMVVADYGEKLDDEGRRMLGVIRSETRRMGRLIDDLLAFARLGRQQIEPAEIDMRALAQAVFDELAALEPERQLRLALGPLPPACGSQAMIRQAWVNLIGNAIKFTQERAVGEIEIGAREDGEGGQIYFIKDNGAGFDMRYVGKLFGVFQRLHTKQAFEGTGVGLALVQRIVQRHGGRVWAEAEVDRGATFSFTIPNPKP